MIELVAAYAISTYIAVIFVVINANKVADTRGGLLLAYILACVPLANTLALAFFGYALYMKDGFIAWCKTPLDY